MHLIQRTILATLLVLSADHSSVLFAGDAPSPAVTSENDRYLVTLTGPGEPWFDPMTGGRMKFTFSVTEKGAHRQYPVYLDNVTAKVNQIALFHGKLIVMGEDATLHSAVTSLIDFDSRSEVDSFIGYGNTLSETGRYMSYRKFFPQDTADPEATSDLVLIYDLTDTAAENRIRGEDSYRNDPIGRLIETGHPVYPEANAGKKHYRVWVREEAERHIISPKGFFWFDHDRKLAFGDQVGDKTYLVVVDLSGGLNRPVIHKTLVDPIAMLGSEAGKLQLESVQGFGNGNIRVRFSSGVPLMNDQLEWSLNESTPLVYSRAHPTTPPSSEP